MRLCNDVDVSKWEPMLYTSAAGSERYVCSGSGGVVSGTQFTVSDNEFILRGVEPGFILRCWNELAMIEFCCEIIEVQAEGNLVVSTIRPNDSMVLWSPGSFSNLKYAVISYSTLIEDISSRFISRLQLVDSVDELVDSRSLRHVCVFAVVSAVYASMARTEDDELYWQKSDYYRKLYEREYSRFKAGVDVDGDGEADKVVSGNSVVLKRG